MATVSLRPGQYERLAVSVGKLILATPSGDVRNAMTYTNIRLLEQQMANNERAWNMSGTDNTFTFSEDELSMLRDAVEESYNHALSDDDAKAYSDLHERLGGEALHGDDEDEEEGIEDTEEDSSSTGTSKE